MSSLFLHEEFSFHREYEKNWQYYFIVEQQYLKVSLIVNLSVRAAVTVNIVFDKLHCITVRRIQPLLYCNCNIAALPVLLGAPASVTIHHTVQNVPWFRLR